MNTLSELLTKYFKFTSITFRWNDILEIILFAVMIYYVILWIKKSRAWVLIKGAAIITVFYLFATLLELSNLLYIFKSLTTYIVFGCIVLLQPEIRKALTQLGQNLSEWSFFGWILGFSEHTDILNEKSIDMLVSAAYSLGNAKTGALIVIEKNIQLDEYVSTGILLNADITSQLLEQIFEHNTPLHDGAAIIRKNKILAATCYLPLSHNPNISKELGTRHRAGMGISEVSDSVTIIVSEETGSVTLAKGARLYRNLDAQTLKKMLVKEFEVTEEKKLFIGKKREKV